MKFAKTSLSNTVQPRFATNSHYGENTALPTRKTRAVIRLSARIEFSFWTKSDDTIVLLDHDATVVGKVNVRDTWAVCFKPLHMPVRISSDKPRS